MSDNGSLLQFPLARWRILAISSSTDSPSRNSTAVLALAGCIVCWAATPVMLRHLTSAVDAWTANGVRYPLSALLYWPVLWYAGRSGWLSSDLLARCILPGLLALGAQILWALAPYYLPASSLGFFNRMSFVWALLGAMIVFQDERRLLRLPSFYVGITLCALGFLALSWSTFQDEGQASATGVVIMLFCSLGFGLYGVAVRGCLAGVHPLVGFGVVCQYVSLGTLLLMSAFGVPSQLLDVSRQDLAVIAVSSVVGIGLGHVLMYTAVQHLGATITSAAGTLGPFVTVVLASVFLGERMTTTEWVAGVTMIAGALVLLGTQQAIARNER